MAPADGRETLAGLLRLLKGVMVLTFICPLLFSVAVFLLSHASGWQLRLADALSGVSPAFHFVPILAACIALGWAAALMPLYFYANFSAYMDMVIGMGRMLGFRLPENFNYPFAAVTLQDFFQRWHMTMSKWFQDYIFTPTVKKLITRWPSAKVVGYLGLVGQVVTFFAVAFWHGIDLLFLKIGFLLALFVVADRGRDLYLTKALGHTRFRNLSRNPGYRALTHTLSYGAITVFVFVYIRGSGNLPAAPITLSNGVIILGLLIAMASAAAVRALLLASPGRVVQNALFYPRSSLAMTLLAASMIALLLLHGLQEGGPQYPGFIYARF